MVALSALAVTGLAVAAPAALAASPAPGYNVFVGYADTERPNAASFPTPFDSGNGVVNEGQPSGADLDGGAIRITNATAATETVDFVTVTFDTCTFDLWPHNVSLPFGGQLVLDQTAAGDGDGCTPNSTTTGMQTMDSSDFGPGGAPWAGNCSQSGVIPQVMVSVNGVATTYNDTGQVLNTGGVDGASCDRPGIPAGNESAQWVSIGAQPCATGAMLALTPPSQTQAVGQTATVTGNLSACGTPLQGATVNFDVLSGPNAGRTGSGVSDSGGNATFSYPSSVLGTDTVSASVTNAAGTISSNNVTVVWQQAPSATTLSSSVNPSAFGQPVTFTATVTGAPPGILTPQGTVTFRRGTIVLGSGTLNATGHASLTTSALQVGTNNITASYGGDANFLPSTSAPLAQVLNCGRTVSGLVVGLLNVTNSTCLVNATVIGSVAVQPGAALSVSHSSIAASLTSTGASTLSVCASGVTGLTTINGTTGFVLVGDNGDDGQPGCAGNRFTGVVTLDHNGGQAEIGGNTFLAALTVNNTIGTGPDAENTGTEIEHNSVTGTLSCSGNVPAATNDGQSNSVSGLRSGQCSAPTF